VYLVGPEANRFVLLEHRAAFSHDLGWTPIMGEIMGKGLLNMDGAPHDAQRKMMNPAFTQDYMDRYLPIMNRVIDRYVSSWLQQGTVNVYEEARKITFDVAAEALVGFSDQTDHPRASLPDRHEHQRHDLKNVARANQTTPFKPNR
jgi:retinoid hydroxylase